MGTSNPGKNGFTPGLQSQSPPVVEWTPSRQGFSTCHPIYDDHVMYLTLKHAIYSAIQQSHATATFMFLPSWGGPMSTNPYSTPPRIESMLTLTSAARWEPCPQQPSTMPLPPSGSARKLPSPATPGACK
eukprot:1150406-Pelagomonas_calceolata.AAC.1